jgi:hypothetical protein
MSFHVGAENWKALLNSAITSSQTTINLASSGASGAPGESDSFIDPWYAKVGSEIVEITAVAQDTPSVGVDQLIVSRGALGTSAAVHSSGDLIYNVAAWAYIEELQTEVKTERRIIRRIISAMLNTISGGGVVREADWDAGFAFCVRAQSTPDMTVRIGPGSGVIAGQVIGLFSAVSTSALTAPVSNSRIDVVQISNENTVSVKTGTEAPSPSAPSVDSGNIALAQITLQTDSTTITSGMITDVRSFL